MPLRDVRRWTVGAVEILRVQDPEFELILPQDEAAAATLKATPWLCPDFVTDEQALRVSSSAIAVRTPSVTIVSDPFLAFDDPARLAPRLAALRAAGVDPAEVDIVVNSHVEGFGANVLVDGSPAFPKARYLFPAADLDAAIAGEHGAVGDTYAALSRAGVVEGVIGGERLTPGVRIEDAPGHSRGHIALWIDSGGMEAVITGHLFLHPAQIASPEVLNGDLDPDALIRTRRSVLAHCVRSDTLMIGPLFAPPGGGKVRQDGATWRLQPA